MGRATSARVRYLRKRWIGTLTRADGSSPDSPSIHYETTYERELHFASMDDLEVIQTAEQRLSPSSKSTRPHELPPNAWLR
jgi:hypothetical protein